MLMSPGLIERRIVAFISPSLSSPFLPSPPPPPQRSVLVLNTVDDVVSLDDAEGIAQFDDQDPPESTIPDGLEERST